MRIVGYDFVGVRDTEAFRAPPAQRDHALLEFAPVRRQLVRDAALGARARRAPYDAGGLELFQARREDVARNVGKAALQFAKSLRADQQIANDQQRPAFAHELERPGEAAILAVASIYHESILAYTCLFA